MLYLVAMGKGSSPGEKQALEAVIERCGGQTAFARQLTEQLKKHVSQQWVWNVVNRAQLIPAEWCLPLEKLSGGWFSRHDFRPDLYPRDSSARRPPASTGAPA